jgi:hypothetical protein
MAWVEDRIYAAGGDHIPDTWGEFSGQAKITAVVHLHPGGRAFFRESGAGADPKQGWPELPPGGSR